MFCKDQDTNQIEIGDVMVPSEVKAKDSKWKRSTSPSSSNSWKSASKSSSVSSAGRRRPRPLLLFFFFSPAFIPQPLFGSGHR
ncbi:hypothetical protein C4D60_Mb07t07560 [Musa balbisiana]|uniref:Uncharacterized protein n=1 Tax=Musa balbisiana TaxID=52838 RepID=A0A4S8JDU7_MUSBA|nr:hypothetical protein C4D60_Mb07t07560 [Musa balbisiana]